jgi:hypothetical protein
VLHKTTFRRVLALGLVLGVLAAVAPATSLAGNEGGHGPSPTLGPTP